MTDSIFFNYFYSFLIRLSAGQNCLGIRNLQGVVEGWEQRVTLAQRKGKPWAGPQLGMAVSQETRLPGQADQGGERRESPAELASSEGRRSLRCWKGTKARFFSSLTLLKLNSRFQSVATFTHHIPSASLHRPRLPLHDNWHSCALQLPHTKSHKAPPCL